MATVRRARANTRRRACSAGPRAGWCVPPGSIAHRLDLDQQVAPADIGLQIQYLRRGAEDTPQFLLDGREVFGPPHIYLVAQARQLVAPGAEAGVGCFQHGGDIAQRLARLRAHITGMRGLEADDAGGTGDEQRLCRTAFDADVCKSGNLGAVLGRIIPGTALTRILERDRGLCAGDAVHRQRAGVRGSACVRGRYVAGDLALYADEGFLARAVEMPIALAFARLAIDFRQNIPDAQRMRQSERR